RLLDLAAHFAPPLRLVRISRLWSIDKVVPGLAGRFPCETFLRLLDETTALYVDIFEFGESEDGRLRLLPLSLMHQNPTWLKEPFVIDTRLVMPTSTLRFAGREYPVPGQVRAYLTTMYGADLTPDRRLDPASGQYVKRRASSSG